MMISMVRGGGALATSRLAALLMAFAVAAPLQAFGADGAVFAFVPPGLDPQLVNIELDPVGRGRKIRVQRGPDDGAAFFVEVPAGRYTVRDLGFAAKPELFGGREVEVREGMVTDLGAISWFQLGGQKMLSMAFVHPEASQALEAKRAAWRTDADVLPAVDTAVPKGHAVPANSTGLGLVADLIMAAERSANAGTPRPRLSDQTDPLSFFTMFQRNVRVMGPVGAVDGAGNSYFGAELGQVRVRSAAGEWAAIDTGVLAAITTVGVDGEFLLAGTVDGRVLRGPLSGGQWQTVGHVPGPAMVQTLVRVGESWWAIAASYHWVRPQFPPLLKDRAVYRIDASSSPTLSLVAPLPVEHPTLRMVPFAGPFRVHRMGDSLWMATGQSLLRLHDDGRIETVPTPHFVNYLGVDANGRVLSAGLAAGAFGKLSFSTDEGRTWESVQDPPYVVVEAVMASATEGQALRYKMKMLTGEYQFLGFDAASGGWKDRREPLPVADCPIMFRPETVDALFCHGRDGSIVRIDGEAPVLEFLAD